MKATLDQMIAYELDYKLWHTPINKYRAKAWKKAISKILAKYFREKRKKA